MITLGARTGATLEIQFGNGHFKAKGALNHFHGYEYKGSNRDGAYVRWSTDRHSTVVETDRWGLIPYFIYQRGGTTVISDSLSSLTKAHEKNLTLNYPALAVYLRLGHHIGDHTPFNEIRRLPANTILRFTPDGVVEEKKKLREVRPQDIDFESAAKHYAELMDETLADSLSGIGMEIILPLSGGRDSRHILAALHKAGRKPALCITQLLVPPQQNDDVDVSRRITREMGLDHEVCPSVRDLYLAESSKNALINHESTNHAWLTPVSERLREMEPALILDGLGGDILSESKTIKPEFYDLYSRGCYAELAEAILGSDRYLVKQLRQEAALKLNRPAATALLCEELLHHEHSVNPLISFFLSNRSRRGIAPSCWNLFGSHHHVLLPYLAQPVTDFLMSLPAQHHQARTLHTTAIAIGYPEIGKIPYAGNGSMQKITPRQHLKNLQSSVRFTHAQVTGGFVKPAQAVARTLLAVRSRKELVEHINFQKKFSIFSIPETRNKT